MTSSFFFPEAFGTTIFCDDLRFEVDGKMSLIGSYSGDMLVRGDFPVSLPKFAVAIQFIQRKATFVRDLQVKVFLPGDADGRPSIVSTIAEIDLPAAVPDADDDFVTVRANLIFSPLALERAGLIRVRVTRNGIDHAAGALRVIAAPRDPAAGGDA